MFYKWVSVSFCVHCCCFRSVLLIYSCWLSTNKQEMKQCTSKGYKQGNTNVSNGQLKIYIFLKILQKLEREEIFSAQCVLVRNTKHNFCLFTRKLHWAPLFVSQLISILQYYIAYTMNEDFIHITHS